MFEMTRRRSNHGGMNPTDGAGYAPVSLGTGVRANSRTPPMRMTGTDRIGSFEWTGALPSGSVLFNLLVYAGLFKSLRDAAKSRQHIKYHRLSFKFSSATNTARNGSYVAAFISDADDEVPVNPVQRCEEVAGAPGMIEDSIWKTRSVNVVNGNGQSTSNAITDPTPKGHYTSVGPEKRDYSPGYIRAVVDAPVDQAGAMVLYCTYDVTLYTQARQIDSDDTLKEDMEIRSSNTVGGRQGSKAVSVVPASSTATSSDAYWEYVFPDYERPEAPTVFELETPMMVSAIAAPWQVCSTPYIQYLPDAPNGTPDFFPVVDPLQGPQPYWNFAVPDQADSNDTDDFTWWAIAADVLWTVVDLFLLRDRREGRDRHEVINTAEGCTNVPRKPKGIRRKLK